MLRTTISKLRQVCALTFVPRLLRGDIRYTPDRFEKLSVCVQRRVDKSTSSSKNDDEDQCIRCQRIIDRAFSPNHLHSETTDIDAGHKESLMRMITPEPPTTPEKQCEKCQRIINEIFGEENAGDRKRDTIDPVCIPVTELQATTAKENAETLAQKVEHIDETPLVEAPAKSKIEGFNVHPKVLGNRKKRRTAERNLALLHFSSEKSFHGRKRGSCKKDGSFDELAKRCLDSPSSHIDERLLKEMEQLGVPPTSRRGSRRTANDSKIVQPEIMKRPRRPVAKTELDFLTTSRLRNFERLNAGLPPPFELMPNKANTMDLFSDADTVDDVLRLERLPPYHLKDQILKDVIGITEDAVPEMIASENERPPQQLLGHMTAAVMSDESNVISDKTNEMEHVIDRKEHLKPSTHQEITSSSKPKGVLDVSTEEKISLLQLKKLEQQQEKAIPREKLASTNILTDLVDPKEISPQSQPSGIYDELDMLRNLLRTRVEYLTQEKVKRLQPKHESCETSSNIAPQVDQVLMKEFSESQVNETVEQEDAVGLKMERHKPYHLKEDTNIISKETSPYTEPGVLVRDCNEDIRRTLQNDANRAMFKSYSPMRGLITPHELFEELAIISRETEIGVLMDDISELNNDPVVNIENFGNNNTPPKSNATGHIIENVGIVSKGNPPSEYELKTSKTEPCVDSLSNFNTKLPLVDPYDVDKFSKSEVEDNTYILNSKKVTPGLENTPVPSESKSLSEDEEENPVIAVETSRWGIPSDELFGKQKILKTAKEPVLDQQIAAETVARETILSPLLDKSTVAHVGTEKLNENVSTPSTEIPSHVGPGDLAKEQVADQPVRLSELLKRVRERNRLEFCKQYQVACPEVDPVVGECGKKSPPCPPPAPTCPPPPPKPCPPTEPPCPKPCKPKCPPTCPPTPCEPKPKCPPPKKSPCEKFQRAKCSNIKIQDALTLLLYLGPQLHIPQKSMLPFMACTLHDLSNSRQLDLVDRLYSSIHNLCTTILMSTTEIDPLESVVTGKDGKDYAKTYDPWVPIPSWPIPIKEEKRKLVCPKDGCKEPPPKLNPTCRDINPCVNFPKKHFSIIDIFCLAIGRKKVMCDIGEF